MQHTLIKIINQLVNGELDISELDQSTYDKIYSHYLNSGEMPYGVAKARTGDPDEWILDALARDFGVLT